MVCPVKIKPAMLGFIPFVTDDPSNPGKQIVHEIPFHVFPVGDEFAMRIGDNVLRFNAEGDVIDSDARFYDENAVKAYAEAWLRANAAKNKPPTDLFFPPGTFGNKAEQASIDAATAPAGFMVIDGTDNETEN